jgi:hypothetical protein
VFSSNTQGYLLPLLGVLMATSFLTASILWTKRQPLLKASPFALLVHGLERCADEDLGFPTPETAGKLEHIAEGMVASLQDQKMTRLKFVRQLSVQPAQP